MKPRFFKLFLLISISSASFFYQTLESQGQGAVSGTPRYYPGGNGLPSGWYVSDSLGRLFPVPAPSGSTNTTTTTTTLPARPSGTAQYYPGGNGLPPGYYIRDNRGCLWPVNPGATIPGGPGRFCPEGVCPPPQGSSTTTTTISTTTTARVNAIDILMYTMPPPGICPPCESSKNMLNAARVPYRTTYAAPPGGRGYPYFQIIRNGAVATISGGLTQAEVNQLAQGQLPASR